MTMKNASAVLNEIESAFGGVALGDGISLNMCEYDDSGGLDGDYFAKACQDERFDWHRVIGPHLAGYSVTFSFTDAHGYRFYLPAYMAWTIHDYEAAQAIRQDDTTSRHDFLSFLQRCYDRSNLIHNDAIYAIDVDREQFIGAQFNSTQLSALMSFLEFVSEREDFDTETARDNLRKLNRYVAARGSPTAENGGDRKA